jgi:hypothetical protein
MPQHRKAMNATNFINHRTFNTQKLTPERCTKALKDRISDQRGGSEWEPIKILSQKNSAYIPITTPRVTHEQAEAHTNLS